MHALRRQSRWVAGAAILIGIVTGGIPPVSRDAQASHVACAEMVAVSIALDSDLLNCPGTGLIIGADNVTIDLNGHTIDGDDGLDNGIVTLIDHAGITIKVRDNIEQSGTIVRKTTANGNGELGIEAVAGTTGGCGNRARGNGTAAQCSNVVRK